MIAVTITAKFSSTCPACGGAIAAGSEVEWTRGQPARHAVCPAEPVMPEPPVELAMPSTTTREGRMLLAGQIDATVVFADGEHVTVFARALRRAVDPSTGDRTWERVALLEPGARVRLAAAKRGQRIGWIGERFAAEFDAGITSRVRDAVVALFDRAGDRAGDPTVIDRIVTADVCGRCGRELTDPESITRGIGPECFGKLTDSQHAQVHEPRPAAPAVRCAAPCAVCGKPVGLDELAEPVDPAAPVHFRCAGGTLDPAGPVFVAAAPAGSGDRVTAGLARSRRRPREVLALTGRSDSRRPTV